MGKVFSLMLLLATMLTFTACGGDDDEPENSIPKEQLIGLWDATAVQFNNDGKWIDITSRPDLALSISFYEDGSYYGAGALGDGEGTYTLSGNTIKTYIDGELYGTYVVKSLVGDNAELTLTMDGETMGIKAKKSKLNFKNNDLSIIAYAGAEGEEHNDLWRCDIINGNDLMRRELQFVDGLCMSDYCEYTISDRVIADGWKYSNTINIDGVWHELLLNNQNKTNYFTFSFDGRILVLRDEKGNEKVYNAEVKGDTLKIENNGQSIVFDKYYFQ